jgi:hypothetical protein
VIAVSQASTKVNGYPPVIIQNSKAEKTVNFTAENLDVTLTPVSNLKLEKAPGNNVLATWDAEDNPLVSYEVYLMNDYSPYSQTVDAPYCTVELYSGTIADVSVRKIFRAASGDFAYYSPSEPANETITVFTVSGVTLAAERQDNALVRIRLTNVPSTGLAQFELSRYKFAASAAETPAWTPISLSTAQYVTTNSNDAYWDVYDTLPANSENATFVYRLVGKYPGVDQLKSVAYSANVNPLFTALSLKTITLTAVKNTTYPPSPSTSIDDLDAYYWLIHDIEADAEYAYYRKQTTGANGVPLPANVKYDWVEITPTDKLTGTTSQTVKVTVPEARTYYELKVVATGTGSKVTYKGVEAAVAPVIPSAVPGIQFRPSITPSDATVVTEYFDINLLSSGAISLPWGTRSNSDSSQNTGNVYSLNLAGLTGDFLRQGERLDIELISDKGDVPIMVPNVTRTTSWYGQAGDAADLLDINRYYFVVPIDRSIGGNTSTTPLYTTVRLYVTAR